MDTLIVATLLLVVLQYNTIFVSGNFNKEQCINVPCKVAKLDATKEKRCGGKGGYAMECSDADLFAVPCGYPKPTNSSFTPPLRQLDLSYNNITKLSNGSFVGKMNLNATDLMWLSLDNNCIDFIDSNAFQNLSALLYLNLTENHLLWPGSFASGVFMPLVSLENLNLKENTFDNFTNLGQELKYLTNLYGLFIDAQQDCRFGTGFENLTNLTNVSLSGRSKEACQLTTIESDMFDFLPQVKNLWMSSCNISSINASALTPLLNIELLDISYNEHLNFSGMNTALAGLRNSSTLKLLNVNHINPFYEAGITLKRKHLLNLKTLESLETLHMDLNKIEVFEPSLITEGYFPATLKNLTLTGNRLTFGEYVKELCNLTNITFLDISRQHLTYDPFFWEHYEPADGYNAHSSLVFNFPNISKRNTSRSKFDDVNCNMYFPPKIKKLVWRKSFLYTDLVEVKICSAHNLHHLDMSFNMIYSWKGPVRGLESLKHLDLSDNTCYNVSDEFFSEFKSLQHLDVSRNDLGPSFDRDTSGVILGRMQNLTRLDMSYCRLGKIHDKVFYNLTKLQTLNVSSNMLPEFEVDLDNSNCLDVLDLSNNKIDKLSATMTNYLDSLVTSNGCNRAKNVTLYLSMNALVCNCDDLPFVRWLKSTSVHVEADECKSKSESKHPIKTSKERTELLFLLEHVLCKDKSWQTWLVAGGSTLLGIIISSIVCAIIYKYRWKLRYIYYSRNRRYLHEGFEHVFANDVMISYAKGRASFIKNDLLPALERQGLTVWVADKHSRAGASIAENITHAIYNSRKTVLLIEKPYMKDSWCNYEMNMALVESVESKRKLVIVVLMESLQMDRLPINILRFLRSERSLEYPEHEQHMDTFWTNLADEIQS